MLERSFNNDGLEQAVAPPRKQRVQLTPTACLRCRAKKIKCTGEPQGCRSCRIKHVQCVYPNPSSSSSSLRQQLPMERQTYAPTTTGTSTNASSSTMCGPDDWFACDTTPSGIDDRLDLTQMLSQEGGGISDIGLSPAELFLPLDVNSISHQSPGKQYEQCQPAWMASLPEDMSRSSSRAGSSSRTGSLSRTGSSSRTGSPVSTNTIAGHCGGGGDRQSCSDLSMDTIEKLHLHMVQCQASADGSGGDVPYDQLFHLQNSALAADEVAAGCANCMRRSANVTMVAVRCNLILDSVDLLLGLAHVYVDGRRWRRDSRHEKEDYDMKDDAEDPSAASAAVLFDHGAKGSMLGREDQAIAIRALMSTRVARVERILSRIEPTVEATGPVGQQTFLRIVRARVTSYAGVLSSSHEGY
ncbi:hypothetical protein MCOR25_008333 [Pyricularia grisea]|nr:hypothetical protein MCOR25_008333 [Pyricularia grisea]